MNEHEHVAPPASHAHDPNVPTDTKHRGHLNYLLVFLTLAVLTAVEVGITYVPQIPQAPALLGLSFLKVALVLLYFMHLRIDSKWYSFIFLIPFVLVIPLLLVLRIG